MLSAKSPSSANLVGLIATTWRGGSTWLYYRFRDTYPEIQVHHEAPMEVMIARPGLNIGWPIARDLPAYRQEFGDIPLVHIVRDPIAMAVSGLRQGLVETIEAALDSWFMIHERILMEHGVYYLRLKAEDLWADPTRLYRIAQFFELSLHKGLSDSDGRTDASAQAVTIPAFVVPSRVQVLGEYFGYEVPDKVDEMVFEHDTVTRDKLGAEVLTQVV